MCFESNILSFFLALYFLCGFANQSRVQTDAGDGDVNASSSIGENTADSWTGGRRRLLLKTPRDTPQAPGVCSRRKVWSSESAARYRGDLTVTWWSWAAGDHTNVWAGDCKQKDFLNSFLLRYIDMVCMHRRRVQWKKEFKEPCEQFHVHLVSFLLAVLEVWKPPSGFEHSWIPWSNTDTCSVFTWTLSVTDSAALFFFSREAEKSSASRGEAFGLSKSRWTEIHTIYIRCSRKWEYW